MRPLRSNFARLIAHMYDPPVGISGRRTDEAEAVTCGGSGSPFTKRCERL